MCRKGKNRIKESKKVQETIDKTEPIILQLVIPAQLDAKVFRF